MQRMSPGCTLQRNQRSVNQNEFLPPCPHRLRTRGDFILGKKLPIFYSALLLTGVNLLLQLIGTSFQVYLSGRIGAEGIGLLQLVLSVGSMAMVAGIAGIRTATMYLTAEEVGKNRKDRLIWVLSGCVGYSLIASLTVGIGVYLFAPMIATHWIGNARITDAIRLFAAFLPVNCLCGVMVGYFTGTSRIGTLAAVEVAEQFCSMICTVLLLGLWAGHDAEKACQSVVVGSGMGSCLTLASLVLLRLKEPLQRGNRIPMAARLRSTAVPLALADNLRTGISTAENLMVPKRLSLYKGVQSPLAAFGTLRGMVFPVLVFPMAILFGLTELLIPELARCNAAGSQERIHYLVKRSLHIALLYGSFCGCILYLLAEPLCMQLYASPEAGRYLKWFAPLAVMLYCDSVTDAIIKGMGEQKASVRYNICTNAMDVALLYLLLPKLGIAGYFISFTVTHAINFMLSLRRLLKITKLSISVTTPLLTLSAAVFAAWAAGFTGNLLFRAAGGSLIFICLLRLTGVLRRQDFYWVQGLIKVKRA